jgi:trehalose 6-phosphate phosphatase
MTMLMNAFNHSSEVIKAILDQPKDSVAIGSDFDGTLADFNDDPNAVRIPDETHDALVALTQTLNGAVAIITGRDTKFIEEVIFPEHRLAGSYGHGAYLRRSPAHDLEESAVPIHEATLDELLSGVVLPEGIKIERKPQARALHWKNSALPEEIIKPQIKEIVEGLVAQYNAAHPQGESSYSHVKAEEGRKVYEIGSVTASKGYAIDMLAIDGVFADKKVIYFGDQPADAPAMEQAIKSGGIAIGVGPNAPAIAQYRLEEPKDVRAVIKALAEHGKWRSHSAPEAAP